MVRSTLMSSEQWQPEGMDPDRPEDYVKAMEPAQRQAFLQFMKESAKNPDALTDYFHIPKDLPPDWQTFFETVLTYGEKVCDEHPHERVAWEKRGWFMEDEHLNEYEMMLTARMMREQGNTEFKKGDLTQALVSYSIAIRAFPLPDAMLNLAQVTLMANMFSFAEECCTKAFDTGMIINHVNKSKAFFRRAKARRQQGNFTGALEDIHAAAGLTHDPAIQAEILECERLAALTEQGQLAYIAKQPRCLPRMSWDEALRLGKDVAPNYTRVSPSFDMRTVLPPIF